MALPMTGEGTGEGLRDGLALPALLPVLVAGALYLLLLLLGERLLSDPDVYWHAAVGRWMVENGTVPVADPFSFTFAGSPWIAKEWLSQAVYAVARAFAGWTGVVVVAAAAIALAFGLLVRALEATLAPLAAVAFAAVAFLVTAPHLLARPHALALPVMVAFVAGLVRAADRGRAPSLWLLPLMALWANLHGGFLFGLLLTGAFGLDAAASAPKGGRLAMLLRWAGFGVLALLAACLTPYGPGTILAGFRVLGLGPALSIIVEWRPPDFSTFGGLEAVLLGGLGLALWRGIVLPPVRILILLGLVHMALSAERNAELLGLLAPLVLARPLARQVPALAGERPAGNPRAGLVVAAASLALLVPATFALSALETPSPAPRITPSAAASALIPRAPGRILNDYDFGGYLIDSGIPTFVDGRSELYGGAFIARVHNALTLRDLDDFVNLLNEFRIDATLLSPSTPAVAFLDRLPGWRRVFADAVAVAHIRAAPEP